MIPIVSSQKTTCNHCRGTIEFCSEELGQTIECYHCGLVTLLLEEAHAPQAKTVANKDGRTGMALLRLTQPGFLKAAVVGMTLFVTLIHLFFIVVILFPGRFDQFWREVLTQLVTASPAGL